MSDMICVTNRALCKEDFLERMDQIAKNHPLGIILREKDLSPEEYKKLAKEVSFICRKYRTPCILHSFTEIAIELNIEKIHLPIPLLQELTERQKRFFKVIGASCHSLAEAKKAERIGCTYITAGHIFPTGCKSGLPGRGLEFLQNICEAVSIPVYAIGGIDEKNISFVRKAGAKGACIMSGFMQCSDISAFLKNFEKAGETIGI